MASASASTSVQASATTSDGVTLRYDRVPGDGPRVLCLHAMMTDGRYFGARRDNGFARALGADVHVADFRGHGASTPELDDWSFDDLVQRDLPALVEAIQPHAILGHSLGGLVALAGIATGTIAPPRRLVLAATSVWLGGPLRRRALMAAYGGITRLFRKAPIRALRAGTADESKSYVAQLTGWCRTGRWTSRSGLDYLAALDRVRVPALAVTGAGDWMCKPDDAAAIAGRIAAPLRIVGTSHGDPLDPDHFELLTRPELTAFRAELADFVTAA
jgi:pimeloyl-ACP methyl ester carboxylesterase